MAEALGWDWHWHWEGPRLEGAWEGDLAMALGKALEKHCDWTEPQKQSALDSLTDELHVDQLE